MLKVARTFGGPNVLEFRASVGLCKNARKSSNGLDTAMNWRRNTRGLSKKSANPQNFLWKGGVDFFPGLRPELDNKCDDSWTADCQPDEQAAVKPMD